MLLQLKWTILTLLEWLSVRIPTFSLFKFSVIPAESTTLVEDHIEMHEIVCNVVETKNLVLYRGAKIVVEQEDDDARIEIEV